MLWNLIKKHNKIKILRHRGGTPKGNRTPDYTVRGCRLNRLTIGALRLQL